MKTSFTIEAGTGPQVHSKTRCFCFLFNTHATFLMGHTACPRAALSILPSGTLCALYVDHSCYMHVTGWNNQLLGWAANTTVRGPRAGQRLSWSLESSDNLPHASLPTGFRVPHASCSPGKCGECVLRRESYRLISFAQ